MVVSTFLLEHKEYPGEGCMYVYSKSEEFKSSFFFGGVFGERTDQPLVHRRL